VNFFYSRHIRAYASSGTSPGREGPFEAGSFFVILGLYQVRDKLQQKSSYFNGFWTPAGVYPDENRGRIDGFETFHKIIILIDNFCPYRQNFVDVDALKAYYVFQGFHYEISDKTPLILPNFF